MNAKRYLIAGTASLVIHGVLLSSVPSKIVMAMPVGTESTRVSLNLVSAPTPELQPTAQPQTEPPPAPAAEAKPVEKETTVKKLVKKKEPEVIKPKPVKKVLKPAAKMPVKKPEKKLAKTKPAPAKPKPAKQPDRKIVQEPVQEPIKKPVQEPVQKPVPTVKAKSVAQAAAGVNSSPKLVTQPTFATRPSPVKYPRLAKRRGIEGQVTVEVWIDPDGNQIKQTLVKSSGAQVLDKAALAAIKRWRFSSHIVDGQAIAHRVQIPVRFKLD